MGPTVAPSMDTRIVMCKGKSAKDSNIIPGKTFPHDGCTSFFWKDVEELSNEDTMVSTIITGHNTSLTIYSTDDLSGQDKFVVGPHEVVDLTHVRRKTGPSWDDSVRSVGVMAWNECTQHLYKDSCIDF